MLLRHYHREFSFRHIFPELRRAKLLTHSAITVRYAFFHMLFLGFASEDMSYFVLFRESSSEAIFLSTSPREDFIHPVESAKQLEDKQVISSLPYNVILSEQVTL